MKQKWFATLVVLALMAAAVPAGGAPPATQTLSVWKTEFALDDSTEWKVVTDLDGSTMLMATNDSIVVAFMLSPIRSCETVMSRLKGDKKDNKFAHGWYKKANFGDKGISACAELKSRSILASITYDKKISDDSLKHLGILMQEVANTLNK